MKRGFMDFVVQTLLPTHPGETAPFYAREYLEVAGNEGSDAKHPKQSLANTLSKQVQTGKEKRISRKRIGGVYRYFLASQPSAQESEKDIVVQISLPAQESTDVDNLVAVGKFENRSSAIKWLVTEGVKTNRAYLDKVADTRNQIERLKKEI